MPFKFIKGRGQKNGGSSNANGQSNNYSTNYTGKKDRSNNRSRIYCQVCLKPGHGSLKCYKRVDQKYQGLPQESQVHMAQQCKRVESVQGSSNSGSHTQPNYHQSSSAYLASPETVNNQAWYVDGSATST
ncbi:hypothetical protein Ddye_009623 [Dipteronia dyeriana]|uniref:Uncharacterized protein n=1 Tax=Dipteronia dyeriana TaxID=168575 RepID=A0AAD9XCD2_9ROSI|nr:hypothetical protein Ddye_009623 [Dipteronia dyeriana]